MKFYGKSDIGSHRTENQDCFGIYEILPGVVLLAVCDGMGGAAGGATASRLALDTFAETVRDRILPDSPEDAADLGNTGLRYALEDAAAAANRAVWERACNEQSGCLDGMGTTLVALLAVDGTLAMSLNVGDSRMYAVTPDAIEQITRDHSYVQYLIDLGQLTYEEARSSPVRNVITRAVGIGPEVRPDIVSVDITPLPDGGKRFILLCTDGLSGCVDDNIIAHILRDEATLEQKADSLVNLALGAGGPDNITVIIVEL